MCLEYSTDNNKYPDKEGYGWKIFIKINNNLYSQFQAKSKKRKINEWLNSNKITLFYEIERRKYFSGWHIFKTRKEARLWKKEYFNRGVIRKVKYKNILCQGRQMGLAIIVARKMLILPEK